MTTELTQAQRDKNKEEFIGLIQSISREGADITGLVNKLQSSDFFTAPASTTYHGAYVGGLCEHSLHVYHNLVMLNEAKQLNLDPNSMKIVALLHDVSKMNYYELYERNVKNENNQWVKVPGYRTKDARDRFIYAGHGANSEYITARFIPLALSESVAIINHMAGKDIYTGAASDANISEIFNRYQLALYLHLADMISTFGDEAIA